MEYAIGSSLDLWDSRDIRVSQDLESLETTDVQGILNTLTNIDTLEIFRNPEIFQIYGTFKNFPIT